MDDTTPVGADGVCVDVETTGLDPTTDRVLSIGAVAVVGKQITAAFEQLINPGAQAIARMGAQARKVHGLDAETLAEAQSFEATWPRLQHWIEAHARTLPPIAHNATFDHAMIAAELDRAGIAHPWRDETLWIDTWSRSRAQAESDNGGSRHGLDALARRLGVRARNATKSHEARADAMLLARCWIAWEKPRTGDLFSTEEQFAQHREDDDEPMAAIRPALDREGSEEHARQWRMWWDKKLGHAPQGA